MWQLGRFFKIRSQLHINMKPFKYHRYLNSVGSSYFAFLITKEICTCSCLQSIFLYQLQPLSQRQNNFASVYYKIDQHEYAVLLCNHIMIISHLKTISTGLLQTAATYIYRHLFDHILIGDHLSEYQHSYRNFALLIWSFSGS